MEIALAVVIGIMFTFTIYLLLSRYIIRMLLGVVLLGNSVNLSIFVSGRIGPIAPPLIPGGLDMPPMAIANAVPQALVLTAIVISFASEAGPKATSAFFSNRTARVSPSTMRAWRAFVWLKKDGSASCAAAGTARASSSRTDMRGRIGAHAGLKLIMGSSAATVQPAV